MELFQLNVKGLEEIADLNNKGYKMTIERERVLDSYDSITIRMYDDKGHVELIGGNIINE